MEGKITNSQQLLMIIITFATTSNPLVPLSNLWTIPGRTDISDITEDVSSSSSETSSSMFDNETVGRLQWCRIPFTRVPEKFPGAG